MPVLRLGMEDAPIAACGFDVDGTLRDTGWLGYLNCCKAIRKLGGNPPEFEPFVHGWVTLIEYYRSCGVTKSDEEIRAVNKEYLDMNNHEPPFSDVEETLERLETLGISMFALSGHTSSDLERWCMVHGLHVRFKHVRGDGKDKIQHLRELCERLGVEPNTACYVGDWGQDMRAATHAGMIGIGITRSHPTHDVLLRNGARLVVETLSELTSLIAA